MKEEKGSGRRLEETREVKTLSQWREVTNGVKCGGGERKQF